MKNSCIYFIILFCVISCGERKNHSPEKIAPTAQKEKRFPSSLQKVFEAHGGLETWKKMNNLHFELEKPTGVEVHSTDLNSRKIRIKGEDFTIGFDGKNVWKRDPDNTFDGNARFYHNLMFYFYAMPFIVSDPGAFYTERKDSELIRKPYGVIHIGFGRNIGNSPDDEYIIFYNKQTFKMEWLGYTVTYFDNEKNNEWHYIKYDSWLLENGLLLPEKMVWYQTENGRPAKPSQTVSFSEITISESRLPDSLFVAPEGSVFSD